ncbi:hypothetical protein OL229_10395 [Neisseriaceae bacterium JH1-16]|nr:hypothetical protein [Neisseriaceae bacterium JH1-16]
MNKPTHTPLSTRHLALVADIRRPASLRYRHLAANFILNGDYENAVHAMWASTTQNDFIPLETFKCTIQGTEAPLWLTCSGEAVDYPRSTDVNWLEMAELTELHIESSRLAISHTVRSTHGAIAYLLEGRFGFAIQSLKSSQKIDRDITLEDLYEGELRVDRPPTWACISGKDKSGPLHRE